MRRGVILALAAPIRKSVDAGPAHRAAQEPTERRYENAADAIEAIRAFGVSWSEGDIRANAIALTQIDETAVRTIYLENGDYDARMAALSDPAALDIPAWVIRGAPAEGGLNADEHAPALAERVGSDHVVTIAGAGHSPQPTHPEATFLAILRPLAGPAEASPSGGSTLTVGASGTGSRLVSALAP